MAIISCKGSALVREIHLMQNMNKSRPQFWELAGSKLGDVFGVQKTAWQIDADTVEVGIDGEIDFKEEVKFAQHLKQGEVVSEFAKSKTIAEQRQHLPIYSVRDELLQPWLMDFGLHSYESEGFFKKECLEFVEMARSVLLDFVPLKENQLGPCSYQHVKIEYKQEADQN